MTYLTIFGLAYLGAMIMTGIKRKGHAPAPVTWVWHWSIENATHGFLGLAHVAVDIALRLGAIPH